jgi:hypothetical protein
MRKISEMVSAINAELASSTKDRILAFDPTHFYLFKEGLEELSPRGLRATLIDPLKIQDVYFERRGHRIDTALDRMAEAMRIAGSGSIEKSATGYALTESGVTSELTEAQFVELARDRGFIAQDDPFFV